MTQNMLMDQGLANFHKGQRANAGFRVHQLLSQLLSPDFVALKQP